jgi:hypothetical protein
VNEDLWRIYERVCQEEFEPLGSFVERLCAGEWGPFPKEDVLDLLHEIEGQVLSNIQIKALEGTRYAEMADEVSEQTQKEFEALAALVERAFGGRS